MKKIVTLSIFALFMAMVTLAVASEDDLKKAAALMKQAGLFVQQEEYQNALAPAREALTIKEKVLGPEHPDTAENLTLLAEIYDHLGLLNQAESLYRRAIILQEKHLGPEHPKFVKNLETLAELYADFDAYDWAEPLWERALEIREHTLDPEHPDTAATMIGLGLCYRHNSQKYKAEQMFKEALEIRKKYLGPEHLDTADCLIHLALLYSNDFQFSKAKPLLEQALSIREKKLGPEHPDVATTLVYLSGERAEPFLKRAMAIREKVLGPEHPAVAEILHLLAENELHGSKSQQTQAKLLFERALAIGQKNLDFFALHKLADTNSSYNLKQPPDSLNDFHKLSSFYRAWGAYRVPNRRLRAVSEMALAAPDIETAKVLSESADFYLEIGARREATMLYELILAIREKELRPDHPDVATTLNNLAMCYWIDEYDVEVEPLLKRAMDIREKSLNPQDPDIAESLHNLGRYYLEENEFEKAEPLLQRAHAIREKALGPEHPDTIEPLCDLSKMYTRMGSVDKVKPLLERALSVKEAASGPYAPHHSSNIGHQLYLRGVYKTQADHNKETARGLATLYWEMGATNLDGPLHRRHLDFLGTLEDEADYIGDVSKQVYLEILARNTKKYGPEHPDTVSYLIKIGFSYMGQKAYLEAESYFQKALAIREKNLGPTHPDSVMMLRYLAALYKTMGAYEQAETFYKRALAIMEKGEHAYYFHYSDTVLRLASLYQAKGDADRAGQVYRRALVMKSGSSGLNDGEFSYLSTRADSALTTGRFKKSVAYYEDMIELFENARVEIGLDERRVAFQAFTDDLYGKMCAVQLALEKKKEAFEALERGRAKSFMDLLGTRDLGRGTSAEQMQNLSDLETRMAITREQKTAALAMPQGQKTRTAQLNGEISELDQQRLKLIQRIQKDDPELGSLVVVDPPSLTELQSLLEPGVALVEYYHVGEHKVNFEEKNQIWMFVVHRGGVHFETVDVHQFVLKRNLSKYARLLTSPASDKAGVREQSDLLHGWLVRPLDKILKKIKARTLIVVPWGPMFKIPFASLTPKKGPPVGQTYNVVVTPSAGLYRYLVPKRGSGHDRLTAFGNPQTALSPLPGAQKEAREISLLFGKTNVTFGEKSTETLVKSGYDQLGRPDVVHFACHGIFNEQAPQLSYLALTPDQDNDGKLEMHEIFGLDWKGVSLVTLSACSSGKGKLGGGQDLVGLMRGFMFAGAPSVLASLWDVDDDATRELMVNFYKNYSAGMSKPESLRQAQAALIHSDKWSHPYYWSAFVLYGDWM